MMNSKWESLQWRRRCWWWWQWWHLVLTSNKWHAKHNKNINKNQISQMRNEEMTFEFESLFCVRVRVRVCVHLYRYVREWIKSLRLDKTNKMQPNESNRLIPIECEWANRNENKAKKRIEIGEQRSDWNSFVCGIDIAMHGSFRCHFELSMVVVVVCFINDGITFCLSFVCRQCSLHFIFLFLLLFAK